MLQQQINNEENHEQEPSVDLDALRLRLQSKSVDQRSAAEMELRRLSPQYLIDMLVRERKNRARRLRWLIFGVTTYVVLSLLLVIFVHHVNMFTYFGSFSGILAAAAAFSPAHKYAAKALAQHDDIENVGYLVEALAIPDFEVQTAIRESLTRVLPRLRASDARRLNSEQRAILRKQLTVQPPAKGRETIVQFILAELKALEQIGDESFLEPVEKLANGHTRWIEPRIVTAASDCLPFLKQRIEYQRLSHDLLRAAGPTHGSDPTVLLRPAASTQTTDPGELLRSGDRPFL